MKKKEIFKSGFVKAFLCDYFEEKTYSFYPDKDRLLYILCENNEEKKRVTKEQINKIKAKISEIGFEELSYAYLLSCKPESLHNYIEPNERFDFWLNKFVNKLEEDIESFYHITQAFSKFTNMPEDPIEALDQEDDFWEAYPESQKPETEEILLNVVDEAEVVDLIELDIQEFQKTEYWEIDFEEYQKYIATCKPIELLFSLSELLVQLNRFETFKDFLNLEEVLAVPNKLQKPQLSLKQIALIHVYSDNPITEHNGKEIAEKYGWNSGHKLWQHFNFYYQKTNRRGLEPTKKRTMNKIELIESVVELLPTENQERVKDEVLILKRIYEAEY